MMCFKFVITLLVLSYVHAQEKGKEYIPFLQIARFLLFVCLFFTVYLNCMFLFLSNKNFKICILFKKKLRMKTFISMFTRHANQYYSIWILQNFLNFDSVPHVRKRWKNKLSQGLNKITKCFKHSINWYRCITWHAMQTLHQVKTACNFFQNSKSEPG